MPEESPQRSARPPSSWSALLRGAGVVYLALGLLIGAAWLFVGIDAVLFPTGWILPAVLLASGGLMLACRRFDIAITLWAGLTMAIFTLAALTYTDALTLGLDDPAAFDSAIIAGGLGLVVLVLRPGFRD